MPVYNALMLDATLRPVIDRPLGSVAKIITAQSWIGVSPDWITVTGFIIGLGAPLALWMEHYIAALIFIIVNRIMDGLDSAVARQMGVTDRGGYLDIVLDFLFYAGVVFGFALAQPEQAIYAALLMFAFMGTASSFLAFAIFAEKRGLQTTMRGEKSLYYLGGLTEGSETIITFILMCLAPLYFWFIALVFAILCFLTTATRVRYA